MDQNGPFWSREVQFGPFRSANRTLAIPESSSFERNVGLRNETGLLSQEHMLGSKPLTGFPLTPIVSMGRLLGSRRH